MRLAPWRGPGNRRSGRAGPRAYGQCVFSAPAVFSLDDDGKLSFRRQAAGSHVCGDLDESLRDDVEEAADVCPLQAITVED
jgi:ferredoxin